MSEPKHSDRDENRDPITGEPGAHPVGSGVGAAGGGTTGAVIGGVVGGPIGAAVGAVIGGVAGGLAGKGVAEAIDPTAEEAYWRNEHATRDYVRSDEYTYDNDYSPAYRVGYEGYGKHAADGGTYDEVEGELEQSWESSKGESKLAWRDAKHATRDAWHRVERALPGDADGDGR